MASPGAVLITGANGGVGGGLCRVFRRAGYRVIGIDLTSEPCNDVSAYIRADIARCCKSSEEMQALRDRVIEAADGQPLSVVVNNAAIQILKPLADLGYADWLLSLETNLIAPAQIIRVLEDDLAAAGGSVINISSVHAHATKGGFSCYATTKSALSGLTRSLAVELGDRIRVNAICPAAINTSMLRAGFESRPELLQALAEFHPLGRIAEPDEIAEVAVFLASPAASFMTGSVVDVDGGILSKLHDPDHD